MENAQDQVEKPEIDTAKAEAAARNTKLPAVIGPWTVNCDPNLKGPTGCFAQIKYVDNNSKQEILSWTLGFNKEGYLLSELLLPTEVMIKPGVKAKFWENRVEEIDYVSCGLKGCLSRMKVSGAVLDNLKTDPEVTFSVVSTQGKEVFFKIKTSKTKEAMSFLGL